jgi:hypothetical protein
MSGLVRTKSGAFKARKELALGHVTGANRVQIVNGPTTHAPGCPSRSPACLYPAEYAHYFLPGDQVIISERHGAFMCATKITATGTGESGWLPADAVAYDKVEPVADDWLGHWHYSDTSASGMWRVESDITVKAGKGRTLQIEGAAKDTVKQVGGNRDGAIKGDVTPSAGDRMNFTINKCEVWVRRFGPWLIVSDNGFCPDFPTRASFSGGLYAPAVTPLRKRPCGSPMTFPHPRHCVHAAPGQRLRGPRREGPALSAGAGPAPR